MDQLLEEEQQQQQKKLVVLEEEEEEVALLHDRRFQRSSDNDDNVISVSAAAAVDVFPTANGSGDTNGIGDGNEKSINGGARSRSDTSFDADGSPQGQMKNRLTNSVYLDQLHGVETVNGVSEVNYTDVKVSTAKIDSRDGNDLNKNADTNKTLIQGINHQYGENFNNEGFSSLNLTPSKESFGQEYMKSNPSICETKSEEDFNEIEEIDTELIDLDVERVIEKQTTHDLYCPNCRSCITRRVILVRRKAKIRSARRKLKHINLDKGSNTELDAKPTNSPSGQPQDVANPSSDGNQEVDTDADGCEKEQDAFRCLSCFSFFIPTGNGFKLFRIFGDRSENVSMQNPPKTHAENTNWLLSIFKTDKKTVNAEKGPVIDTESSSQGAGNQIQNSSLEEQKYFESASASERNATENTKTDGAEDVSKPNPQKTSAENTNWFLSIFKTDKRTINGGRGLVIDTGSSRDAGNWIQNSSSEEQKYFASASASVRNATENTKTVVREMTLDMGDSVQETNLPCSSDAMMLQHENGHEVTSATSTLLINGQPAEGGSLIPGQGVENSSVSSMSVPLSKMEKDNCNMLMQKEKPVQNGHTSLRQAATAAFSAALLLKGESSNYPVALTKGGPMTENVKAVMQKAVDAVKEENTGKDVILLVGTETGETASSGGLQDVQVDVSGPPHINGQRGSDLTIDILKSIVYGGLMESIASLGVVSSAAGAGASTLKVLALGLASLIGGLFITVHNLVDLKNESSEESSNEVNIQDDRYYRMLGWRKNFSLHASVAIISYLIFGLLPPVIYGFSFRKSDDRILKLAVVGGTSLICIMLLAIGKAHVQRQPKSYIRTVLYFLSIGIMASGASYIVGELLSELFEKEGWFESSSTSAFGIAYKVGNPGGIVESF